VTFRDWLIEQQERGDPVGDFARDCAQDRTMPSDGTLIEYKRHIQNFGPSDLAMEAFARAYSEYLAVVVVPCTEAQLISDAIDEAKESASEALWGKTVQVPMDTVIGEFVLPFLAAAGRYGGPETEQRAYRNAVLNVVSLGVRLLQDETPWVREVILGWVSAHLEKQDFEWDVEDDLAQLLTRDDGV